MTIQKQKASTRAIVLGGGGVTGIAWEIGILTSLLEARIALHEADTIIGTSAGAFVGVALASGYDMNRLFAAQSKPSDAEIPVAASEQTTTAWYHAFATGGSDPQRVGAAMGAIAREHPEPVPVAQRRRVVEARLVTTEWPLRLQVTAIDAETGQLHVFDRTSGIALTGAVMASGAVPGVWPPVSINGRIWIDGGMVSTTNARLAQGYERVVILAPMPTSYGSIPGVAEDVAVMSANANVFLVKPDPQSIAAIGTNPYDPTRRSVAATSGRAQGRSIAASIAAMW
ncbi:patatin-like phospholipase family protein [Dictyobacter aurantiacus]|uniref:Patatin n=1 Tax=Dictyobacter aurantiacus TaxID=1936993 RepID=A0A401ZSY7_9CHLR|nr:patatin-like phospholipase family protein [Dictyobacter aurantiacus]GCE10028.1 patatin [Dictyobacter aurantiacus]